MNVSPSNRERQGQAPQTRKQTNPDAVGRGNGHGSTTPGTSPSASTKARPGILPRDVRSDEQLLEAYRFGDKGSFSLLVDRYQRELFHFLVRFLGDRAAAEDVFQETFLQVHQSAASLDQPGR